MDKKTGYLSSGHNQNALPGKCYFSVPETPRRAAIEYIVNEDFNGQHDTGRDSP